MTRSLDLPRLVHAGWPALSALLLLGGLLAGSIAAAETPAEESKASPPANAPAEAGATAAPPGATAEVAGDAAAEPVTTRGTSAHIDSMTDRSSSSGPDLIERHETHLGEDGSTTTITTVTDEQGNTHQAVLRREADGTVTESNTTQPAD